MKKILVALCLCCVLASYSFGAGFSLKLSGGLSYLMGGDYNDIIQGRTDYYHSEPNLSISSDLKKLNLSWNAGAEAIMLFTDSLGVGLGVGYISASNESTMSGTLLGIIALADTYRPTISAVPITLNFHFFLPIGPAMNVHFFAGPGVYFGSVKFENEVSIPLFVTDTTISIKPEGSTAFGFQGGLGLEIGLSGNIFLTLDVQGRVASFSELKGPWTATGTFIGVPISLSGTGTLWYTETPNSGTYYANWDIAATQPTGIGVQNVHAASFSLSGVSAQLGFRIAL
ncbi:MAG: porin family protein [Candidatus Aminicenantes bacterium]|nr:porin family protein [Candidatus Aminicenantes bacterium]